MLGVESNMVPTALVIAALCLVLAGLMLGILLRTTVVKGVLLDTNGQPIANAEIAAIRPDPTDARQVLTTNTPAPAALARSDVDGRFTLHLRQGPWRLAVWTAAADVCRRIVPFTVSGGLGELRCELRTPRGLFITGRVITSGDSAANIDEVTVTASSETDQISTSLPGTGEFQLGPLLAATYELVATPASPLHSDSTPRNIEAGDEGVCLLVQPTASAVHGTIESPTADTIREAQVVARRRDTRSPTVRTKSTPQGTFSLTPLTPGTWDLVITCGDGSVAVVPEVVARAGCSTTVSAQPVSSGLLVLRRPDHARADLCDIRRDGVLLWRGRLSKQPLGLRLPAGAFQVRVAPGQFCSFDYTALVTANGRAEVVLTEPETRGEPNDNGPSDRPRRALF